MKVLILGGTNFIGVEIVSLLLDKGLEVTCYTRGNKKINRNASHIKGDRNNKSLLKKVAMNDYDIVIDNIGFSGEDVNLTLDVFKGRLKHYILTSTAGVYLSGEQPPFFEGNNPIDPTTLQVPDFEHKSYVIGKIEAEWALFNQKIVPFTIIRPPVVIGPNDPTMRFDFYIKRILDGGPILITDCGKNRFSLAYSKDLAFAYYQVICQQAVTFGKAYNICNLGSIDLINLLREAANSMKKKLTTLNISNKQSQLLGSSYFNPMASKNMFFNNFITMPNRACAEINYKPLQIDEAICQTAKWHASEPFVDPWHYRSREKELQIAHEYQE